MTQREWEMLEQHPFIDRMRQRMIEIEATLQAHVDMFDRQATINQNLLEFIEHQERTNRQLIDGLDAQDEQQNAVRNCVLSQADVLEDIKRMLRV